MQDNKRKTVLFSREEINTRVKELASQLTKVYVGKDLVIISLLRGSFIFASDLVREIDLPLEVDFLTTSSYEDEEVSSGKVKIFQDIRADIEGKDVLIVDDIIDTGYTLEKVINHLKDKKPNSIRVCVLLDKPSRRKVELEPDLVGFSIPDLFIVGYGLNYGNYYRNTPYIFSFD